MITNIGKTFILWIAILLAVSIASIIWIQNSLLFYPNTSIFNWSPDERQVNRGDIIQINGNSTRNRTVHINRTVSEEEEDGTVNNNQTNTREELSERDIIIPDALGGISAFYINNFPGNDFLLYCHGTSGNIYDRKYVYDIAQEHQLNVLLFDYHGYGKSSSFPTIEGILKDGLAAYDFLTGIKKIEPEKIIVWGESLGGACAAYIGRKRKVKGIILMSTFSSMPNLVKDMEDLGWARFVLSMISRITLNPLETQRWVSEARTPVVVLHSKEDGYITYECGRKNYEVAKEPKLMMDIEGSHISPVVSPEQITTLLEFIEENQISA